jgi:hypothetical protein
MYVSATSYKYRFFISIAQQWPTKLSATFLEYRYTSTQLLSRQVSATVLKVPVLQQCLSNCHRKFLPLFLKVLVPQLCLTNCYCQFLPPQLKVPVLQSPLSNCQVCYYCKVPVLQHCLSNCHSGKPWISVQSANCPICGVNDTADQCIFPNICTKSNSLKFGEKRYIISCPLPLKY